MQEAQIKVSIDDNEALSKLRDMLDIVERLEEGLGGLEMPQQEGPSPTRGPAGSPSGGGGGGGEAGGSPVSINAAIAQGQIVDTFGQGSSFRAGDVSQNIAGNLQRAAAAAPFGAGLPVAVLGAFMGLMGRSMNARQERLSQVAQLEQLEAGIKGAVDTSSAQRLQERASSRLARLGFDPSASAQLIQGIASSVGLAMKESDLSTERLERLGAAEKLGISSGAFANLAGAISQATGESVGAALDQSLQLRDLAEKGLDLRGAGVEEFLQSFGQTIDDFTRRGITLEAGDFAREITGITRASGTRGERPAQIAASLMGVAQGAGGDVRGALQGFAEASLTASAAGGAGDLFGFLQNLEALETSPTRAADIISRSAGGGRGSAAVLASISGIGTRDAARLAGGVGRGRGLGEFGERVSVDDVARGVQISAAQAAAEKATLTTVRKDQALNRELIRQSGRMEDSLIELSNNTKVLTKVSNLVVSTQEAIIEVEKKVSEAIEELKRRL